MSLRIAQTVIGVNRLLDHLQAAAELKNDAALSRVLAVAPPVISKLRRGTMPFGASLLLQIHEVFELPVAEIKALVNMNGNAAAQ